MRAREPLHLRLSFVRRVPLWFVAALFLGASLFAKADAWADSVFCFPNSTNSNSSISIVPLILYLTQTGEVDYQVSLCTNPTAQVNVTTSTTPTGKITVDPSSFVLSDTVSKTVSVELTAGVSLTDPFTATVTHSVASADPNYDYGSTNVPTVIVRFLPPLAVDDVVTTTHDAAVDVAVLDNDLDRLGQGLTRTVQTNAGHGLATLGAGNTIHYAPDAGFSGVDSFVYRISDGIGNTDTANVTVVVASANQTNPQVEEVDPATGAVVPFDASFGAVDVEVPAGVFGDAFPPDSTVVLVFTEPITPTGDVDNPPAGSGFSGITFDLGIYVDGVEVDPNDLAKPLVITVTLPNFDPGGARVLVAVWTGTAWSIEGIQVDGQTAVSLPTAEAYTLTFSTTVLGEFGVFTQYVTYAPALGKNYVVAASQN